MLLSKCIVKYTLTFYLKLKTMNWCKTLTVEQRINLKDLCPIICGAEFSGLVRILGFRLTINTLQEKLKLEGFEV